MLGGLHSLVNFNGKFARASATFGVPQCAWWSFLVVDCSELLAKNGYMCGRIRWVQLIHSNAWLLCMHTKHLTHHLLLHSLQPGPTPNLPYIARGAGTNWVGNSGWTTDGLDKYTSYAHAMQQEQQDCGGTFDAQFMEFAKQHSTMRAPKHPHEKAFDPNTVYNWFVH